MFYHWQDTDLILDIRVQPKASSNAFAEVLGERIKIRITAAPVDGKANKYLTIFLAKQFHVAKSCVIIISGENGRNKRVKILQPDKLPDIISK